MALLLPGEEVEQLTEFIQQHIDYAPWLIFGALLLAGFNLPVSEDGMLFISALLAVKNPEKLYALFIAVYAGAYFSDLICYGLGRTLGPKLFNIKFFANMVPQERIDKIHSFYEKYGIVTLIFGRFIPFGVRNGLFLTAGLGKMNFLKFSLSDLLACTISCSVFFTLYYKLGAQVIDFVKKFNIIIFSLAAVGIVVYFIWKKKNKATPTM